MYLSPLRSMKVLITIIVLLFSLVPTVEAVAQAETSSDLQTFQENLQNARLEKNNRAIVTSLTAIAQKMDDLQRPDSAVFYYLEALNSFDTNNHNAEFYEIKNKLGNIYLTLYDYDNAIKQLEDASEYFLNSKMYEAFVRSSNQLGVAYLNGDQEILSRRSFLKSIEINRKFLRDTSLTIENNTFLIRYLNNRGDFNSSVKLANTNIKLAEKIKLTSGIVDNLIFAGNGYLQTTRYAEAIESLKRAEQLSIEAGLPDQLPEIYHLLTKASLNTNDPSAAMTYLEDYTSAVNKQTNMEIVKSSKEIAEKFNSEKKDSKIKFLETQNAIKTFNAQKQRATIIFLIVGLVLFGLLLYVIYRNYTNQIKNNQIIDEQKSLLHSQTLKQSQQDNQIIAMEAMLKGQEVERNRIGKDLHDSLGATLSTIKLHMSAITRSEQGAEQGLQKTKELLDDACEEVRKISRDMMPITLSNYGLNVALEELVDKFTTPAGPQVIYQVYGLHKLGNRDVELFIYRVIQELINNCIKHAQADEILLQINYLEDNMVITVEDDGRGFNYVPGESKGMGIKNIEYRVRYLKGNLTIESKPGQGTTTVIEIPNQVLSEHPLASIHNDEV